MKYIWAIFLLPLFATMRVGGLGLGLGLGLGGGTIATMLTDTSLSFGNDITLSAGADVTLGA